MGFWHSTGADDLTQVVAPVSASASSVSLISILSDLRLIEYRTVRTGMWALFASLAPILKTGTSAVSISRAVT